MPARPLLAGALLAALACAAAQPARAAEILVRHFASQEAFADYLATRGLDAGADIRAMAQARAGDSRASGSWELGLFDAGALADDKPAATAQLDWVAQQDKTSWVPFTLSRFGETLAFTIGSATTALALPKGEEISALALSAFAGTKDGRVILRDLELDGRSLDDADLKAESGARDTSLVEGLSGDFTLTGEARMRWDVLPKDPSALMLQVSAYTLTGDVLYTNGAPVSNTAQAAIPEPGSAMAFLAATLALIGHRHRRRNGTEGERDGSGGRI